MAATNVATAGVPSADLLAGAPSSSQRLVSLDAFRGITIAAMILVNNPGTWSAVYPPLLHAPWHGWTPTDLVFPFFLFIVGVAIVFAYQKRLVQGVDKGPLVRKALRRSLVLFALGLLLAGYPFVTFSPFGLIDFSTLRIPGVLQRIAVCYFAASLLFLYTKPKTQLWVAVGLLLGYWALMTLVPVPGYGAGMIDQPEGTLSAYLDRIIFGQHLWAAANHMWDPEGFLSTLPAVVTTLIGVGAGLILASDRSQIQRVALLLIAGVVLVSAGYVWDWFFPINKPIWTSSYALFTGGQALCALGVCYWFIDVRGRKSWAQPFVVYGVNAITVYVLSGLLARTFSLIRVGDTSLHAYIFNNVFVPLGPPQFASLLSAITWVAALYVVALVMYRKKIFVKV